MAILLLRNALSIPVLPYVGLLELTDSQHLKNIVVQSKNSSHPKWWIPEVRYRDSQYFLPLNGKLQSIDDISSFIHEMRVVCLPISTVISFPSSFYKLFDRILTVVECPPSNLEKLHALLSHPEQSPAICKAYQYNQTSSISTAIEGKIDKILENWRQGIFYIAFFEKAFGAQNVMGEWFVNPTYGLQRLAKTIGITDERKIETAKIKSLEFLEKYPLCAQFAPSAEADAKFSKTIINKMNDFANEERNAALRHFITPSLAQNGIFEFEEEPSFDPFAITNFKDDLKSIHKYLEFMQKMSPIENGKTIVHIPARAGSSRLKDKNIYDINGTPLLALTIMQAKMLSGVDRVIVNTDSEQYAEIALQYGAEILFIRPKFLAEEDSSLSLNWAYALYFLMCEGCVVKKMIEMCPTSPGRERAKTQAMVDALEINRHVMSATFFRDSSDNYLDENISMEDAEAYDISSRYKTTGHFSGVNYAICEYDFPTLLFEHTELEESLDIDYPQDMELLIRLDQNTPSLFRWDET